MDDPNKPFELDLSVSRSCWTCHRRKVRCDKGMPCATCVRTNSQCLYPELEKKRRNKRLPVSAILNRLAQLEKKISTLSTLEDQSNTGNPPHGQGNANPKTFQLSNHSDVGGMLLSSDGQSRYFSDALMASIAMDARDVHPASESNMLLGDLRPQPNAEHVIRTLAANSAPSNLERVPDAKYASRLWHVYVKNVDPLLKVLHLPTSKPRLEAALSSPEAASDSQAILLYAISYAAAMSLDLHEVEYLLETDKGTIMRKFKDGIEQYLTKLSLMVSPNLEYLQALIIYITFLRISDTSRAVWILIGLTVRIAQSLGIHKDGTSFQLPPFECELRRRLFWHLHILDIRAAEDYGLQPTAQGTPNEQPLYPTNLNDSDLSPNMTMAPIAKDGITDMTLALLRIQTTDMIIHEEVYPIDKTDVPRTRATIEEKRRKLHEAHSRILNQYSLTASDSESEIYITTQLIWKISVAKSEFLILFRALQHGIFQRDSEARAEVLKAACTILECIQLIYLTEPFKKFSWYPKSYPQYYAIGFVLQQLYQDEINDAELQERARKAVEDSFASLEEDEQGGAIQRKGAIWVALRLLKDRAFNKLIFAKQTSALPNELAQGEAAPVLTPPDSIGGSYPTDFDFNTIGNPLFEMAEFELQEDWSIADFL